MFLYKDSFNGDTRPGFEVSVGKLIANARRQISVFIGLHSSGGDIQMTGQNPLRWDSWKEQTGS